MADSGSTQPGRAGGRAAGGQRPPGAGARSGRPALPGHVFVITGPSGVGKGTLIAALMRRMPELALAVSATTRAPRAGERDGVDYHFMSRQEFGDRVRAGEFVEHVDYAGASYGTLRGELEQKGADGAPVLLEIEVRGARALREAVPEATQIFIAPPSSEELRRRLTARGTDDPEKVERRLAVAREELRAKDEFAHVVLNARLEEALDELERIVRGRLAAAPGASGGQAMLTP
jgi:guanylate kinase